MPRPPLGNKPTSFQRGAAIIKQHLKTMPSSAGVYRMLNEAQDVLYVGKAKHLSKRVASYTQIGRLPTRLQRMVAQTRSMEVVVTQSEAEALLLEANLIRQLQPPFNILLRDDKSFPYILITRDHAFPGLFKHRGSRSAKGWYFGPFASAAAVTETILQLQRGFMLRNCSDSIFKSRTRPCLQYHIKRCTAPCVDKVTEEGYAAQVAEARAFLSGKTNDVQQQLALAMQQASDAQEYETAAKLRDRIKFLTAIQTKQNINVAGIGDADIIAVVQQGGQTAVQLYFFRSDRNFGTRTFFPAHEKDEHTGDVLAAFIAQFYAVQAAPAQLIVNITPTQTGLLAAALTQHAGYKIHIAVPKQGERKRLIDHALTNAREALARRMADRSQQTQLLEGVARVFHLSEPPKRIEVYDNSHIQGSHAVGAMIVAGPEGLMKKQYRKFTIRDLDKDQRQNDDYAMMREVLTRRFKRLAEEDPDRSKGQWPDLVLIDGGQGQLSAAGAVLADLGLADIALAAIAKGPDRNAGREHFFLPQQPAFQLESKDPVLYYLQRLRDEAHRFVIGAHRSKRTAAIAASPLDGLAGVGAERKRALLHHFGSARGVAQAGISDLMQVKGISQKLARKIHEALNGG